MVEDKEKREYFTAARRYHMLRNIKPPIFLPSTLLSYIWDISRTIEQTAKQSNKHRTMDKRKSFKGLTCRGKCLKIEIPDNLPEVFLFSVCVCVCGTGHCYWYWAVIVS